MKLYKDDLVYLKCFVAVIVFLHILEQGKISSFPVMYWIYIHAYHKSTKSGLVQVLL